jgi:hypothetical protein
MTVGIASGQANSLLDTLLGSTFIQLHTADPGAAGTTAVSSVTTRPAATYSAASAGSKALSSASSWTSWAGSAETITHISFWTAATAGTFKASMALTVAKPMTTGDTLNLNTATMSFTPIAA